MSSPFQFKQFTLHQDKAAMKVGTDSMLLGAMISCEKTARILDIGTGTGVLALMLAQRCDAEIDAIDIDPDAAAQASENFKNSLWKERLKAYHVSLQEYAAKAEKKYDLIISNPPYFQPHESLKSSPSSTSRKQARQTGNLTLQELAKGVAELLEKDGTFWVILPTEISTEFEKDAVDAGLFTQRNIFIHSKPQSGIVRVISGHGFSKPKKASESHFTIYDSAGKYSSEYVELTREYHGKEIR